MHSILNTQYDRVLRRFNIENAPYWVLSIHVWENIEELGKRWIYNGHSSGSSSRARHQHVRRMTNLVCLMLLPTLPGMRRRWSLLVINPATKTILVMLVWNPTAVIPKKAALEWDMRARYGDTTLKACFEIDPINWYDHVDWSIDLDHIDIVTRSISTDWLFS